MSFGIMPYQPIDTMPRTLPQSPGRISGGPAPIGQPSQPVFGMMPGYTQQPGQPVGGPVAPNQPNQQYQPYFQQMHKGMDNVQEALQQVEQMVLPGQQGRVENMPGPGLGGKGKGMALF